MRRFLSGGSVLLVIGFTFVPLLDRPGRAADKSAKPSSARELGKQWRYPGLSNDPALKSGDPNWVWEVSGPADGAKNLDRTTMQFAQPRAPYEQVWNFYAAKCGFAGKWKPNNSYVVIERTPEGGQRMVMDQTPGLRAESDSLRPEETDFGLFTDDSVIHVHIRKVDAEQTYIRILTTIR